MLLSSITLVLNHYFLRNVGRAVPHLRRLTQSDLTKGDRTRVMVCITMDAHGRDVVQKMAREGVTMVRSLGNFREHYLLVSLKNCEIIISLSALLKCPRLQT